MKHVVIGGGNLGIDIMRYGMSHTTDSFKLFTASNGFRYPCSIDPILDEIPDHVWVTIGAGSVEGAVKNFNPYADLHIRLVMELAQASTSYTLHVFSSDYTSEPLKSLYAYSKYSMEKLLQILDRPKTNIYRVGSLYGQHKAAQTFPHKLLKNYPKPCDVVVPENEVVPTPTDWIAKEVLSNVRTKKTQYYNVLPSGITNIVEWAKLILGPEYNVYSSGMDDSRPSTVPFSYDLTDKKPEDWKVLWQNRSQ